MWRSLLPYFFGKKIVLIVCLKIVLKQIVSQILTGVACDLYSAGPDLLKAGPGRYNSKTKFKIILLCFNIFTLWNYSLVQLLQRTTCTIRGLCFYMDTGAFYSKAKPSKVNIKNLKFNLHNLYIPFKPCRLLSQVVSYLHHTKCKKYGIAQFHWFFWKLCFKSNFNVLRSSVKSWYQHGSLFSLI